MPTRAARSVWRMPSTGVSESSRRWEGRSGDPSAVRVPAARGPTPGRRVRLDRFTTTAVPYEPGSPATAALLRVAGTTADGQLWSVFLKVLQHPRPGDRALLRHVPDKHNGDAFGLGEPHEPGGRLPHLPHAPRRPRKLRGVERLDRVHHHHLRPLLQDRRLYHVHIRL